MRSKLTRGLRATVLSARMNRGVESLAQSAPRGRATVALGRTGMSVPPAAHGSWQNTFPVHHHPADRAVGDPRGVGAGVRRTDAAMDVASIVGGAARLGPRARLPTLP